MGVGVVIVGTLSLVLSSVGDDSFDVGQSVGNSVTRVGETFVLSLASCDAVNFVADPLVILLISSSSSVSLNPIPWYHRHCS